MVAGHAVADLPKGLEGGRDLLGRHADARILDAEYDALVRLVFDAQPNLAAGVGEFHRIGQQVDENLGQLGGVGHDRRQLIVHLADEIDVSAARHVLHDQRAAGEGFVRHKNFRAFSPRAGRRWPKAG